jgi:glutaredoxin
MTAITPPPLKVYWQPGCSSCLNTKEFLLHHNIAFESINVNADENGYRELMELGVRLVPIVRRGSDWANGAVFRDVARVAGFEYAAHEMLSPAQLIDRLDVILAAAHRYAAQLPATHLDEILPGRPRSYRQLAYHIFNIPEVFLEHFENDAPYTYEALLSQLPPELETHQQLLDYGATIRLRLLAWWQATGQTTDFTQPGNVYYGAVSMHEVLERTAWHSGQHTRQLMMTLSSKLSLEPDQPLANDAFDGLPIPNQVWDNETSFA